MGRNRFTELVFVVTLAVGYWFTANTAGKAYTLWYFQNVSEEARETASQVFADALDDGKGVLAADTDAIGVGHSQFFINLIFIMTVPSFLAAMLAAYAAGHLWDTRHSPPKMAAS